MYKYNIDVIFCRINDIFEHVIRPYSGKRRYAERRMDKKISHNTLSVGTDVGMVRRQLAGGPP